MSDSNNNTPTGGENTPETVQSAVAPESLAKRIMVKVTGAVTIAVEAMAGEKLADVLQRANVTSPASYIFRSSGKPVAASRVLIDDMELTATAKASGG